MFVLCTAHGLPLPAVECFHILSIGLFSVSLHNCGGWWSSIAFVAAFAFDVLNRCPAGDLMVVVHVSETCERRIQTLFALM